MHKKCRKGSLELENIEGAKKAAAMMRKRRRVALGPTSTSSSGIVNFLMLMIFISCAGKSLESQLGLLFMLRKCNFERKTR